MKKLEIKCIFNGTNSTTEVSGDLENIEGCKQLFVSMDNESSWSAPDDYESASAYIKEADAIKIIEHLSHVFTLNYKREQSCKK